MSKGNQQNYTSKFKWHPLLVKWIRMLSRCYNKDDKDFRNYGKRGIAVCHQWTISPTSFIKWALLNGYRQSLCIDRINNDGDYSPSNCRFVTRLVSNQNRGIRGKKSGLPRYIIATNSKKYPFYKKYRVQISIRGDLINVGTFETLKKAVSERNSFLKKV